MKKETAIFACGCFWGVQFQFDKIRGVIKTTVGYIGGEEKCPTYQDVKSHKTGHAEAIQIEYDAEIITYIDLCKVFFEIHDPSQLDGQGPDIGPQYRSEIFYQNENQKKQAKYIIDILRGKRYEVFTKLTPVSYFWAAEEYHQKYYKKTGGEPYCHTRIKKF